MNRESIKIKDKEFILDCILILVILQICRIIIKNILLSLLNFTVININIANIISIMIVGISLSMILRGNNLFNPAGYRLKSLANKHDNKEIRIALAIITIIALGLAVVFKGEKLLYSTLIICLSSLAVPIYEEMIFRQYFWNYIDSFLKDEKKTFIIISILSVLFTIGYWDIISQNLQVISSAKFTVDVVFSKMLSGILIAIGTGFMKYKYNDLYLCIFLHSILACIIL